MRVSISTNPQVDKRHVISDTLFEGQVQVQSQRTEVTPNSQSKVGKHQIHTSLNERHKAETLPIFGQQYSKQIMNVHYMFHMCSATINFPSTKPGFFAYMARRRVSRAGV